MTVGYYDTGASAAKVEQLAEAYATDSGSTARLVWTVNTSTNEATIEQTAATGYSDGTWNGSAISLTADEIQLNGDTIIDGGLSVAGYLDSVMYTVPSSWTTIGSVEVERRQNPLIFDYQAIIQNSRTSGTGGFVRIDLRIRRNGSSYLYTGYHTFRTPAGETDSASITYRLAGSTTGPASSSTDTFDLQMRYVSSGSGWDGPLVDMHSWMVDERLSGPQAFSEASLKSDIISAGLVDLPSLY